MAEADSLDEIARYARVARNSQMLLVMEPPTRGAPEVEEARDAIAEDALSFLNEVEHGVESPYFTAYTRQDRRYLALLAAEKVRQSTWDRCGIFELAEPKLKTADAGEAQAATFAYLAASWMRQVKAPFYQAPSLRAGVPAPRNLAEFVRTVDTVRDVTVQARDSDFHLVVQRNDWRVAFAFWEANRRLARSMGHSLADD